MIFNRLFLIFTLCFLGGILASAQEQTVINPEKLEAAVHVEKMTRSVQQGDTLIHNAAAYQVMQGADSESLISKMAGIVVSDSGIEASGRDVARILLDGQEFFGNDVLTALRTIPADMVKQVEVINKLSDNAQLSGVDDGEGYTVLNIVTKRKRGTGTVAGRLYGSYGSPDKYITGGNLSRFADKNTFNVIGMSNNISKFNFNSSDILSGASGLNESSGKDFKVKPLSGISSVHSLGTNYSDKKLNFSYFFSYIDNMNQPESEKMAMTSKPDRLQQTNSFKDHHAVSMTHRFSGKISLSPAKRHTIIIRPEFSLENTGNTYNQKVAYRYVYTTKDPAFLRHVMSQSENDKILFRASPSMTYRYAFKNKKKRTLSAQLRYNYYGNTGDTDTWQYKFKDENTSYAIEEAYDTYVQRKTSDAQRHTATAQLTFTEPVTKRSMLSAQYYASWSYSSLDNIVSVLDDQSYEYEESDRLSGVSEGTFVQNKLVGRYSYARKKLNLTFGASYLNTLYIGEAHLPSYGRTSRNYNHFLYQLTANLPINKAHTLKIEAKSRTVNPSMGLLQDVVNMSSTSNVRTGNSDLAPAYINELEFRYVYTDRKSGSSLSFIAELTGSPNYFCDSLVIDTPDFEVMEGVRLGENNQFVKPVNLSGYYKLYTKTSYTIPITWLRCNFNIHAAVFMKQVPNMVNEAYVPVNSNWYQLGGRLDSNISRNIDFRIGYDARYTSNEYNGRYGLVQNNFYYHRVYGKLKWIFVRDFTFSAAAQFRNMVSLENLYNDKMLLCDVFIGKKFMPSRSLELSVGVNDLFDQNVLHYTHSANATSISNGTNIGLGRYVSIQCIWNFRSAK
ncbi:MAG: outer membrane beta-barrel protein [Bacteroidales bacterium]|nr:outer membrane beta-barrel protein [Bacteroidales bacterium]